MKELYDRNRYFRYVHTTAGSPQSTSAASLKQPLTKVASAASASNQMDASKLVKQRVDSVIKSAEDKRQYRALELTNGIRALLVSDPNADKAAASLDVNAGHLMDPRELPGLAHFCEHMLFLGTKKYESENEYSKFLNAHGGHSNAYTGSDHTNYHFDVAPEHLPGAIDRFAQFFHGPLFTESATEREVMAVDSENSNNLKQDPWRIIQLERSLSNPSHDYSKFGTGNKVTLMESAKEKGIDTREALLKFHSKCMAVCIVGKESLDELEAQHLLPYFADITNLNIDRKEWTEHPYTKDQVAKRVQIVPIKDLRNVMINFPIPDLHKYRRTQPGHYLSHLLGHEGPGSLLSELKRRGWCNSLSAGPRNSARGFGFFSVDMDLSEEGLLHTDEIIVLMFQYLGLLRADGIQEWIHKECGQLNEINFRFKDTERSLSLATSMSSSLHDYPLEEVLVAPYIMDEFKPEIIEMVLSKLVPENMMYAVLSQSFAGQEGNVKEQWYGTEYSIHDLEQPFIDKCNAALKSGKDTGNFKLPEPNEFIPEDFKLCAKESQAFDKNEKLGIPRLVRNTPEMRVWYKQDDEFLLPKCFSKIHLTSPLIYADPARANLAALLSLCLSDSLTEYTYNAHLAGLSGSFECGRYGIGLTVKGYNNKQTVFAKRLIEHLVNFKPDPARFEVLKELHIRSLRNFSQEQPYSHATYHTSSLLSQTLWTKENLLTTAENLTVADLEKFVPDLLDSVYMQTLVHGNMSEQDAIKLSEGVWSTLTSTCTKHVLVPAQIEQRCREHEIPSGHSYVFESVNDTHSNSAIELVLQVGVHDIYDTRLELLTQIMAEPAFDTLRTKEQLGYIVFCGSRNGNGTEGLRVIVQGEKNPKYVEARVEAFLVAMKSDIDKMSEEEFNSHKQALITRKKERCKKLSHLAEVYWSEIMDLIEIDEIEKITKSDVIAFYDKHVSATSDDRRKLTTRVYSKDVINGPAGDAAETQEMIDDSKSIKVENPSTFKPSLGLYPLPRPYQKLAPKPPVSKL